jgi:hypothetical protein
MATCALTMDSRRLIDRGPRAQTAFLLCLAWGGISSCTSRADDIVGIALVAPYYVIAAPWILAGLTANQLEKDEFRRQVEHHGARPDRIPDEVARSVAAMSDVHADTIDQLLDNTGLSAYESDVLIVFFGTVEQDLWVYYHPDAALNARFDPITRRIVGPITNYSGGLQSNNGHTPIVPRDAR